MKGTLLEMKSKLAKRIITVLVLLCSQILFSQDFSKITTINVDELSDGQIEKVWTQAQQKGYSLEQLAIAAKSKGMPIVQVEKLKSRIRQLETNTPQKSESTSNERENKNEDELPFGLTGKEKEKDEEDEDEEEGSRKKSCYLGLNFLKTLKYHLHLILT